MSENQIFVLLIDGDNVQLSYMPYLLEEIFQYRKPIISKVYLNESSLGQLAQWKPLIAEYSLYPEYIPNNVSSKNAVDIGLIIDTMALLYTRPEITHFLLVSSDSDFTQLAMHIVSQGKAVIGFGESKTPKSFRRSCTNFVYVEKYLPIVKPLPDATYADHEIYSDDLEFEELLVSAYDRTAKDEDDWSPLLEVKTIMAHLDTQFQSREYYNTRLLAEKIKAMAKYYPLGVIEVDEKLDMKPVLHDIRIDCDALRFVRVYKMLLDNQDVKDGWITLSAIGSGLSQHPSYPNGFKYQGSSKLSSIISMLAKNYPEIELDDVHPQPFARIRF